MISELTDDIIKCVIIISYASSTGTKVMHTFALTIMLAIQIGQILADGLLPQVTTKRRINSSKNSNTVHSSYSANTLSPLHFQRPASMTFM